MASLEHIPTPPSSPAQSSAPVPTDALLGKLRDLALSPAQASFIREVVLAEVPKLSERVKIESVSGPGEQPSLLITSSFEVSGKTLTARYQINFDDVARPKTPDSPSLTETNQIQMPINNRDPGDLYHMACAWRRVTIADGNLYAAHCATQFIPRAYQKEAVQLGLESCKRGEHPLLQMFTGTGKTETSFILMDQWLESEKAQGRTPGKVIFMVNNDRILGEAEKSLNKLLPKYKTSQCYDGHYDTSGDVIFATPMSIGKVLPSLLGTSTVSMLINDETHHLPADTHKAIYHQIEQAGQAHNQFTPILGLTATPLRPDQKSVVGYYSNSVQFRYDYARAFYEGYAPAIRHHAHDMDMPSHAENPAVPILPGSSQYEKHVEERYHPSRFAHIIQQLRDLTSQNADQRAIVAAPNKDFAYKFAAACRTSVPPIAAVALTSDDTASAMKRESFDLAYNGFKHQSGLNPPQVLVGVQMFAEGINVPGVPVVVYASDDNSPININQKIGRGARPAVGKTHLDLSDVVGLYRKLPYIQTLAQLGIVSDDQARSPQGTETESQPTKPHSVLETLNNCRGDAIVEGVLQSYLTNVPLTLSQLYGSYKHVPAHERIYLDDFLANCLHQAGELFDDHTLSDLIADTAKELFDGDELRAADAKMYREQLFSCFSYDSSNLTEDQSEIVESRATRLVFERLEHMIRDAVPAEKYAVERVLKLFPEFDPLHQRNTQTVASNLATLRAEAFRMEPDQLAVELQRVVLSIEQPAEKKLDPVAHSYWQLAADSGSGGSSGLILVAEGRKGAERVEEFDAQRARGFGVQQIQNAVIAAYRAHPKLNERIKSEEFGLAPNEFRDRLVELGLIDGHKLTAREVNRVLTGLVTAYRGAFSLEPAQLDSARNQLGQYLEQAPLRHFLAADAVDNNFVATDLAGRLFDLRRSVVSKIPKEHPQQVSPEASLLSQLDRLMEISALRFEVKIPQLNDCKLVLERDLGSSSPGPGEFRYFLKVEGGPQLDDSSPSDPLYLIVRRNMANQFVCMVERQTIMKAKTPPSRWQAVSDHLGPIDRSEFINAAASLIDQLGGVYHHGFTVLVPQDNKGSSAFRSLMQSLIDLTPWDVIGQVGQTSTNTSSNALQAPIEQVLMSRLSLGPEMLQAFRRPASGEDVRWPRYNQLVISISYFREQMAERVEQFRKLWQQELSGASVATPEQQSRVDNLRYVRNGVESILTSNCVNVSTLDNLNQFLKRGEDARLANRDWATEMAFNWLLSASADSTLFNIRAPQYRIIALKKLFDAGTGSQSADTAGTAIDPEKFNNFLQKSLKIWHDAQRESVGRFEYGRQEFYAYWHAVEDKIFALAMALNKDETRAS